MRQRGFEALTGVRTDRTVLRMISMSLAAEAVANSDFSDNQPVMLYGYCEDRTS